jgi:large subunit ribosomal protein L22
MEVLARAKFVRRAPRKARLVADQVRGLRVSDALAQLEFSPKHAARDVAKAIKSAAANAEHNHNLDRDDLWLVQILVDEGPTMKRIRPVSRGMAHQYFHRTCHITAVVEDRPELAPARPARRRLARPAARPAPAPAEEPEVEAQEPEAEEGPEAEAPEAEAPEGEEPEAEEPQAKKDTEGES